MKLWRSSKCVEEECMPRLHYLKLGANYVFESAPTIWRCTKWVCVEISRCLKLLLQCMDVEACEKLEFLAIKGSCEMSQGGVGHYRLKS